jgi:putative ABC transport system permease protein
MTLMVRTHGPFDPVAERMRREIRAMDAELPLGRLRPLEDVVTDSLQRQRLVLVLIGAFAAAALLLAAVGIYGVMSYAVVQRVPEVGVRLALGARPADVLRLVLGQALAVGALGIALGLVGALAAGGVLASQLYEIGPRDPIALAAVALTLLLVVLAASAVPARRAARVDPLEALRTE